MVEDERALGRSPRVRIVVLALAAIAGWLDGLTFVALGTVFVSAVTGDLVQLGVEIAAGDTSRLLILLAALAAFMAGTSIAVVLVRTAGSLAWPGPVRRPLLLHAGLLVVFALLWTAIGDPSPGTFGAFVVVAVAALSAGIQGAAILGLGIRGASVSAVTNVLMLLAAGLAERESGVAGPRRPAALGAGDDSDRLLPQRPRRRAGAVGRGGAAGLAAGSDRDRRPRRRSWSRPEDGDHLAALL